MFDIFTSNIADTIKECAPQKTIFIRNDKPKINYEDDNFIYQLFNSKKNEREKWSIINDTKTQKNCDILPELTKRQLRRASCYVSELAVLKD